MFFPALDPATASNISNYTLINLSDPVGSQDKSRFITSATFVPTGTNFVSGPNRVTTADPYAGRIDLTFSSGLDAGNYQLIAHTTETVGAIKYGGLADAAGNALDETSVSGQGAGGNKDFVLNFNVQPQAVYITSVTSNVTNAQGNTLLPRSYFEINPRARRHRLGPRRRPSTSTSPTRSTRRRTTRTPSS